MPAPRLRAPVGSLRIAARRAVASASLRIIADKIGISHAALRAFLNGATPRESTVRKLSAWYVAEGSGEQESVFSAAVAHSAIQILLDDLPEDQRPGATRALLAAVRRIYSERGHPPPSWLRSLDREQHEESACVASR